MARLAKSHGAKFKLNREVVDIERTSDGDFVVRTSDGSEERGDVLINAAGLWSKQISEMIDPFPFESSQVLHNRTSIRYYGGTS